MKQLHKEDTKMNNQVYGNYVFEEQIYMNPLSSFLAFDGYKEYYALTENSLIVTDETGNQQEYAIAYKKTVIDKQEFKKEFLMEDYFVPNISSFQECYQLTDDSGSSEYRIYQLDNEVWLVRLHRGATANVEKSDYIWSIYKILKFDGEIPYKVSINGSLDRVKEFMSLQGDFKSGF